MELPIVDISPFASPSGSAAARGATVAAVRAALERAGFLVVSGHGVDPHTVAAAHAAYRGFYGQPADQKLKAAGSFMKTDDEGHLRHAPRGYSPGAGDAFSREAFAVQKEDWDPSDPFFSSAAAAPWVAAAPAEQNLWPEAGAGSGAMDEGFQAAVLAYYAAMERLAVVLEEIMAAALGLPAEYFVQRADRSITNMVGFSFAMGKAGVAVPPHDDEGDFTILSHDGTPFSTFHRPFPCVFVCISDSKMLRMDSDRGRGAEWAGDPAARRERGAHSPPDWGCGGPVGRRACSGQYT